MRLGVNLRASGAGDGRRLDAPRPRARGTRRPIRRARGHCAEPGHVPTAVLAAEALEGKLVLHLDKQPTLIDLVACAVREREDVTGDEAPASCLGIEHHLRAAGLFQANSRQRPSDLGIRIAAGVGEEFERAALLDGLHAQVELRALEVVVAHRNLVALDARPKAHAPGRFGAHHAGVLGDRERRNPCDLVVARRTVGEHHDVPLVGLQPPGDPFFGKDPRDEGERALEELHALRSHRQRPR